mmetsp:Transcript_40157/g.45257  ORF Transcript_40157/g.45257 Transcript_40157/m.45257 type:complete len:211 (-) Transcript_40157:203-835(-)
MVVTVSFTFDDASIELILPTLIRLVERRFFSYMMVDSFVVFVVEFIFGLPLTMLQLFEDFEGGRAISGRDIYLFGLPFLTRCACECGSNGASCRSDGSTANDFFFLFLAISEIGSMSKSLSSQEDSDASPYMSSSFSRHSFSQITTASSSFRSKALTTSSMASMRKLRRSMILPPLHRLRCSGVSFFLFLLYRRSSIRRRSIARHWSVPP